jgi:CPA1 family monovalent cation:H+ antiporter
VTQSVPLIALLLFAALAAIVVFSVAARFLRVPYPVIFVTGGAALAFVPHAPQIRPNPEWIFLIVLPPLLFSGGWMTDIAAFRKNLRPIALLAIGLVLVTTFAVAGIARLIIAALPWAAAVTLGAVIAPPDPVAAETVMETLVVPQRVASIISSEGLTNDAVSLVLFSLATQAMVTGNFSVAMGVGEFFGVSIGGIAIGLAVGLLLEALQHLLARLEGTDSLVSSVALLVAPYASYLPADAAHVSGVLAAVAAGMYLGHRSVRIYDAQMRITSRHFWDVLILLINGVMFLLIGFQLRGIWHQVQGGPWHLVETAVAILAAITAVRFGWVFLTAYLPHAVSSGLRDREPFPSWHGVFLVGWTGMRGIVSLAAALSIPTVLADGRPFPFRFEILFLTFCVIFATLIVQGLTIRPIVLRFGLSRQSQRERISTEIRIRALEKGVQRLEQLQQSSRQDSGREYAERLLRQYERRIAHLRGHLQQTEKEAEDVSEREHEIEREALQAELDEIAMLRARGEIPDDVFREIQYDLDLAVVRIA